MYFILVSLLIVILIQTIILTYIYRRYISIKNSIPIPDTILSELNLLEDTLDNMTHIIAIKSEDFKYRYVNKAFCHIISKSKEEIIGADDYDLYEKIEADEYRKLDNNILKSLNTLNTHVSLEEGFLSEGSSYWRIFRSIFSTRNNKKMILSIAVDITDIYTLTRELEFAKKKAEESDKLKSTFLANMSHEIRTPLNAIIGFSELLQNTDDKDEKKEYRNIINSNNEILLRLIGDILDMSKIESGTIEIKKEEFNPIYIFDEIYTTFLKHNNNPDLTINKMILTKEDKFISDKNRFSQICTIYLTNAIKYTPKGQITMILEDIEEGLKITIKDTGIGIEKHKHDLVFKRFEKFDSFAQGNGLGLAICKGIAEAMDGRVGFESVPDKGSSFWAWLPYETE